jgi:hypothetical protein
VSALSFNITIYIYIFFGDILYVLCLIYDQYNCKYWIYVYLYVVWHWLIKNWIECTGITHSHLKFNSALSFNITGRHYCDNNHGDRWIQ